jgi:hypothetical protein
MDFAEKWPVTFYEILQKYMAENKYNFCSKCRHNLLNVNIQCHRSILFCNLKCTDA